MNFGPDKIECYQMDGSKRRIQQRRCLSHVTTAQLYERDRSPFKEATLSGVSPASGQTLEQWSMATRVSQKIQKSEFWNVTYPSGFHRLDEPPEKISAL